MKTYKVYGSRCEHFEFMAEVEAPNKKEAMKRVRVAAKSLAPESEIGIKFFEAEADTTREPRITGLKIEP